MPKAKPPEDYFGTLPPGRIDLPAEHLEEMIEICGVSDERRRQFEEALEIEIYCYLIAEGAVDNFPRPANILAALAPVQDGAARLEDALTDLDPITCMRLREEGFEDLARAELREMVSRLLAALSKVHGSLEGAESRHATPKHGLRYFVRKLTEVFDEFSEIDSEPWDGGRPARASQLRLDFVEKALKAVSGIRWRPVDDPASDPAVRVWPKGVRQPRKTPSRKRLDQILAEVAAAKRARKSEGRSPVL